VDLMWSGNGGRGGAGVRGAGVSPASSKPLKALRTGRPHHIALILIFLVGIASTESPPQRIVSIAPGFTEILYSLGMQDQIAGTTTFCDYPAQAKSTPKIGDMMNPNIEKIISLHPDTVFCGAWKWDVPSKLRDAGIEVVELKDAETVEDIMKRILLIGEKVGKKDRAAAIVSEMRTKLQSLRDQSANQQTHPKVYIELDTGNWTVGGGSYMSEILAIAGMTNIFQDRKEPYMMVTMESIVSRDPDLILSMFRQKEEYTGSAQWQAVRAVRNSRVLDKRDVDWDAITRQSPRLPEGIENLMRVANRTMQ